MSLDVETFANSELLVESAGERLIDTIHTAVAARGRAQIVLTGGGNGNALMEYVGTHGQRIDWARVHLFWGDDRYVPEDDDERNYKQARAALLDHIDIPSSNVHAMPASDGEFGGDLAAAALAYEQLLAANAEPGQPTPNFDVHLLGMGPEGHINSLFPEHPRRARDDPDGGRGRRLPQAATATYHVDTARHPAFTRGLADGVRGGEGRGGVRRRSAAPTPFRSPPPAPLGCRPRCGYSIRKPRPVFSNSPASAHNGRHGR